VIECFSSLTAGRSETSSSFPLLTSHMLVAPLDCIDAQIHLVIMMIPKDIFNVTGIAIDQLVPETRRHI
jgi:hypothetical protein